MGHYYHENESAPKDTETQAMDSYRDRLVGTLTAVSGVQSSVGLPEGVRVVAAPGTHERFLEVHGRELVDKVQRLVKDECFQKMEVNEPFFLLLGRDASAQKAIEAWLENRYDTREGEQNPEVLLTLGFFQEYSKIKGRKAELEAKITELQEELKRLYAKQK